jgi:hypothetical protein
MYFCLYPENTRLNNFDKEIRFLKVYTGLLEDEIEKLKLTIDAKQENVYQDDGKIDTNIIEADIVVDDMNQEGKNFSWEQ